MERNFGLKSERTKVFTGWKVKIRGNKRDRAKLIVMLGLLGSGRSPEKFADSVLLYFGLGSCQKLGFGKLTSKNGVQTTYLKITLRQIKIILGK